MSTPNMRCFITISLLALTPLLSGCPLVPIGGTAVAGTSIHDRRTVGTQVEDQAIEFKILARLKTDDEIDAKIHFNAVSFNTIVLVTGEAPTRALKDRVTRIVKDVPKVRKVHNEMTVAAPSALLSRTNDTLLTGKVKTKMLADKNLNFSRIKVVTERGIVYLMGLVTEAEQEIATELARTVGGVNKVVVLMELWTE